MKNKKSRYTHPLPGRTFPHVPVQRSRAAATLTVVDGVCEVFASAFKRKREQSVIKSIRKNMEEARALLQGGKPISAGGMRQINACFDSLDAAFTTKYLDDAARLKAWAGNTLVAYTMLVDTLAICPDYTRSPAYPKNRYKACWQRLHDSLAILTGWLISLCPEAEDEGMKVYDGLQGWHEAGNCD